MFPVICLPISIDRRMWKGCEFFVIVTVRWEEYCDANYCEWEMMVTKGIDEIVRANTWTKNVVRVKSVDFKSQWCDVLLEDWVTSVVT